MKTESLFPLEMAPSVTQWCADIAVPLPIEGLYSYSVPQEILPDIKPGMRVRVPFKNREMTGYVVGVRVITEKDVKMKPLAGLLDTQPVLNEAMLQLTRWISRYYLCSWGEAIENALPKWVKYGKKAEKALKKQKIAGETVYEKKEDLELTPQQKQVYEIILSQFDATSPKPILLHGVTGSGKSEIYIRLIREQLRRGRSSICLVPEIALTEQIRRFFQHHFGNELEILHSKLTDSERFLAWKRIEKGDRHVILGPRSAVFAPVQHLGLIIMDEEHEGTYKQETVPRYHAREVAAWRAHNEKALFLMGTATPSMETMYQTRQDEVRILEMPDRVDHKAMPSVNILDLKSISQDRRKPILLSPKLLAEIETNLKKGEGTMLLLNRRGFSTHIHCPKCGTVESCQSCQVSLIFHQEDNTLLCHYCNFKKKVPDSCSQCKTNILRFGGFGTERIESEVASYFPTARISRMDADSVKKRGSHEEILKDFREQKIDILIGTQMIAKGFDFPHVTLVGVVLADVGLMLPDFRSSERTFQLLTQVAGRAGRGKLPGRVFIQTFSPDHPSVMFSRKHDFNSFYEQEVPQRKDFKYPPFNRLLNIIVRSGVENKAYVFARELRDALRKELGLAPNDLQQASEVEIIGPSPLPFYKLRGHFRWHVMLKLPRQADAYMDKIKSGLLSVKKVSGVEYAVDVDPVNIL